MQNMIRQFGLKPADRMVVPKSFWQVIQHHVIYLGQDEYGRDWVVENLFGLGVKVKLADEFFSGITEVKRIEKFRGNNYDRKIAVQKALQKVGASYNLINYNCEHFANEVQNGRASSRQILVGISAGLVVLGLGIWFFRR